jgi:hypothetical protein
VGKGLTGEFCRDYGDWIPSQFHTGAGRYPLQPLDSGLRQNGEVLERAVEFETRPYRKYPGATQRELTGGVLSPLLAPLFIEYICILENSLILTFSRQGRRDQQSGKIYRNPFIAFFAAKYP